MATYLIGDVHGCYDELNAVLQQGECPADTDTLRLTGDFVPLAPGSLGWFAHGNTLGNSRRCVRWNNDQDHLAE
ncbi:metallophosphoesterase, partial [Salmonella enterica]|uniref:metallophosphoesterase n=1 Tax=Salmonella enterica TaxID=28901 RepID=UPI00398C7794